MFRLSKRIPLLLTIIILCFTSPAMANTVARESVGGYTIAVTQRNGKTAVKWNGRIIRRYSFHGRVRFVSEGKLTAKMLRKRKGKTLYIERIVGKVTNNRMDGETSCGYYISYKSLKGKAHNGDTIITYCVYNPFTRWTDDVDERYDIIL